MRPLRTHEDRIMQSTRLSLRQLITLLLLISFSSSCIPNIFGNGSNKQDSLQCEDTSSSVALIGLDHPAKPAIEKLVQMVLDRRVADPEDLMPPDGGTGLEASTINLGSLNDRMPRSSVANLIMAVAPRNSFLANLRTSTPEATIQIISDAVNKCDDAAAREAVLKVYNDYPADFAGLDEKTLKGICVATETGAMVGHATSNGQRRFGPKDPIRLQELVALTNNLMGAGDTEGTHSCDLGGTRNAFPTERLLLQLCKDGYLREVNRIKSENPARAEWTTADFDNYVLFKNIERSAAWCFGNLEIGTSGLVVMPDPCNFSLIDEMPRPFVMATMMLWMLRQEPCAREIVKPFLLSAKADGLQWACQAKYEANNPGEQCFPTPEEALSNPALPDEPLPTPEGSDDETPPEDNNTPPVDTNNCEGVELPTGTKQCSGTVENNNVTVPVNFSAASIDARFQNTLATMNANLAVTSTECAANGAITYFGNGTFTISGLVSRNGTISSIVASDANASTLSIGVDYSDGNSQLISLSCD